ncbi:MAG: hypothetical protein Q9227_007199 [Pyrenula ochraceoflavens]
MQFALPPRKGSEHPYARPNRSAAVAAAKRRQMQLLGMIIFSILFLYLFWSYITPISPSERIPAGTPPVVIVTLFDEEKTDPTYMRKIKNNREDYALRHGYRNFYANTHAYTNYTKNAPDSWTLVPAIRHAMTLHPHSTFFFSLSPHSLIMQPSLSLDEHILKPSRLESLMIKDIPVVPPDSVIHTFSHLKGNKVDLVLTQDSENLGLGSFILRQGDWARYFLDAWFDPLYRAYNFQKAEGHALEHIVQWHPTILAKLTLVPQRIMNAYNMDRRKADDPQKQKEQSIYVENEDFLVRFFECDQAGDRNCAKEMQPFYEKWEEVVKGLGGMKTTNSQS